jgi:hypothetical protein
LSASTKSGATGSRPIIPMMPHMLADYSPTDVSPALA